ncbi:MAG: sn-glycerol-3-phosphate ABC transporter ATP-binding protein UgpC [Oscillospiraceae bacterium]|jgi:multiple sugar transport system ATP-binding protein|nr:sn-glycerol-3-phosphate ABC transporter ATP-binding protein UgpC [Oscillospiraceae bacterium]
MAGITFKNVTKSYRNHVMVVPGLNFEIKDKEFVVLVGPSGCGKSTTLRMIAGLEAVTSGEILIGEKVVNNVAPKDRDIAMVFQNYALYPHMTIYKNMAFALKIRKIPKDIIDKKVRETAAILDISDYLDRKPKELSGGQRQRVALGRAMVRDPAVFLLDEPLSNLDAKLRTEMRGQIIELQRKLEATFVYVTHDQTEAMTMADRIIVMKGGEIQQSDTPQVLYDAPDNRFVAGFIGSPEMNFWDASVAVEGDDVFLEFCGVSIQMPRNRAAALKSYSGKSVMIGIRPEDIHWCDSNEKGSGIFSSNVAIVEMMGSELFLYLDFNGNRVRARVPARFGIRSGDKINLSFDINKFHIFDEQTEKTIEQGRPGGA